VSKQTRCPCTDRKDTLHADNLRITVDEVRKRMEAGEDFVLIDTRNPQAWSQSDVKLPGAIRLPLDNLDENLSKIPKDKPVVAYCT
jgi:rhodanese-related sulfurtransferase